MKRLRETLGVPEPIGIQIRSQAGSQAGPLLTVVGVVEDYNFNSLHTEISPLVLTNPEFQNGSGIVAVRIDGSDVAATRSSIENVWNRFVPERSPNISFFK